MGDRPVYLDNHSTTLVDPRVLESMLPYFTTMYGNSASKSHRFGWEAEEAVERARGQVAEAVGARASEIIFTSGATESNNLAIKGIAASRGRQGGHIVSVVTEHRSVLDPIHALTRHGRGFQVTWLTPNPQGVLDPEQISRSLTDQTILVSVMTANNEIGTIQPIEEIGRLCRTRGVPFHTDATQAVGKIAIDVEAAGVDLLSLTAHKFHGPKGIGALYVRRDESRSGRLLDPLLEGGGQERGLRSGTVAVPLVVGLGQALGLAQETREDDQARIGELRDRLRQGIMAELELDGVVEHGHGVPRLAGNLNLGFRGVDGEALMMGLREIAVSSGAACSSAQPETSHVLRALGVSDELARASLRFGLSRFTTSDEVELAARVVAATVRRLRGKARRSTSTDV